VELQPISRTKQFASSLVHRLSALEIIDRALVLGAQAFGALIPLLIVLESAGFNNGRSFADGLVDRFELSGRGAATVRATLTAPAEGAGLTVLGVALVVFSALAFTRAMQRTYELTWGLERRGVKGTGWGILWLGAFALYWTLAPKLDPLFSGRADVVASTTGAFLLWLVTPYVLLARRVPWRRLVPQAALTAGGMTALGIGAVLYIPTAMSTSAADFGGIGCAFTLLSLLWAAGFVLVIAAALGAFIASPDVRG
jgi:membrane protein